MEAADTALFVPDDIHRKDVPHPSCGGVLMMNRDDNAVMVEQENCTPTPKPVSETNLDPLNFELNEFKANKHLSGDAQQAKLLLGDTDGTSDSPADFAAMQSHVKNNIVPFLLARIAQVLD